MRPFANERTLELRRAPERDALIAAARELDARLPLRVAVLVDGQPGRTDGLLSHDPGRPDRVVAQAGAADAADVDAAVRAAGRAGAAWAALGAERRAAVLIAAAQGLRERRLELAALAMRECAKPWPEADADVCEAIDFLEYYARQAVDLERSPQLGQPPGERNSMRYAPLGVVGVIAPWNFPLAIPCGMVAGALAAGNGVVLKPAEQSPACAAAVVDALHRAGVPAGALALLPGAEEPGKALVAHPEVHAIAFTGSVAVGLQILRTAAEVPDGQRHLKRVVAEMGGKNCVIVDSDADLDEAVPAIVHSAFGYAGQKCSAASRVLVCSEVADALAERLAGAVQALAVGYADDFASDVPPLIEAEARERVEAYAGLAAREGRILARGAEPPSPGHFCAPTLAGDLPAGSRVLEEEIFGPLLALQRVQSVEEALDITARLRFGLTGGLFSRNPQHVRLVAERTPVGNLYVNREITGAMVGRQPFGGNRLSGTGSKAGGPDYVRQFAEPHVVSENTTRHGLVI